jgi:hypothetical protein
VEESACFRSGFYFCPLSSLECDAGGLLDQWQEVAKEKVMQVDERQENRIAKNFPIDKSVRQGHKHQFGAFFAERSPKSYLIIKRRKIVLCSSWDGTFKN